MNIIGTTAALNNLYPCRIEQKVYEVTHNILCISNVSMGVL